MTAATSTRTCSLVKLTDVSEERTAFICRHYLIYCSLLIIYCTLKTEAVCSTEIVNFYRTTRAKSENKALADIDVVYIGTLRIQGRHITEKSRFYPEDRSGFLRNVPDCAESNLSELCIHRCDNPESHSLLGKA